MNRVVACCALVVALAGGAPASTVKRASVEDLAEACDAAVVGRVIDHSVSLDRAAGAIRTDFRVRVDKVLVGDRVEELVVRVPGGRVGTLEQEMIGAPKLVDGERTVLFLGRDEAGARSVLALAQGAFRVETDAKTGETYARNSLDGLSVVESGRDESPAEPIRIRLADLESRVSAARERVDARRRAASEATARRLEELRLRAESRREALRGRPGGVEVP